MHYFESQLISRVKAISGKENHIVFRGHYRIGDGPSVPGFGTAISCILLYLDVALIHHWALFTSALLLLIGSVALWVYQKIMVFDLERNQLIVIMRQGVTHH